MSHTRCLHAPNRLFMYLRQNSQIQRRPSGIDAYSSGNGASYHVFMSYCPNLMVRIRRRAGSILARGPPGVDGPGEAERPMGVEASVGIWFSVDERSGREGPGVDKL